MFTYAVLPESGFFRIELQMTNADRKIEVKEHIYQSKDEALKYAEINLLNYMRESLCRFIRQMKAVHKYGHQAFYNTYRRNEAHSRCQQLLDSIREYSLLRLCLYIIRIEDDLRAILPAHGNKTHGSASDMLNELVRYAIRINRLNTFENMG